MVADSKVLQQARYIFSVSTMIRRHVFDSLSQLEAGGKERCCAELSMAQLNLLLAVRNQEEITLSGLAKILRVSSPSASVMVDRLVERGMLIRERSTTDRRKVTIGLSQNTDILLAKAEEKAFGTFVGLVEEVGPETARKWGEVLQRVEEVLQRQNREYKK
jgi:DNA-binding MarR family transcriptional regulator